MLEKIMDFLDEYMILFYLALFVVIVILYVINTISFCKANKKFMKKIEEIEPDNYVSLENAQKITGLKTFTSGLKGYPVIIDKKTGAPKIVNGRLRDEKGRFVKRS